MRSGTLTRRLFARIVPTIAATIVIIGGLAFYSTNHEINHVYDAQLINNANVLWALLKHEFQEHEFQEKANTPKEMDDIDFTVDNQLSFNEDADDYADARMFRIWQGDKIVMYSDTALPKDVPRQKLGFANISYKGEDWRIYSLVLPDTPISVEVGEKMMLRDTLVRNILQDLFLPLFVLIPAVSVLLWMGIKNGLDTIRLLVEQIYRRSPDDLAPVDVTSLPDDLAPLGKSINQLFVKLEHSIDAERRFADHAAHQLRTPLAGLKLQIQMLKKADNEQEREAIVNELENTTDRSSQLIGKLLTAARIGYQPISLIPLPLYKVTASIIADMGMMITQKRLDVSLEGNESAYINADETLLRLLISNLVENAIKFTPSAGEIRVHIAPQNDKWRLSISDTGPGIPADQRDAVFQRFYRVDTPHIGGTGIGLAIVAEIVERLSGSIALKIPESGQGLLVEVLLPKA